MFHLILKSKVRQKKTINLLLNIQAWRLVETSSRQAYILSNKLIVVFLTYLTLKC